MNISIIAASTNGIDLVAAAVDDDDEDDGHHSGAVIMVDTGVLNDGLPKWQSNVHDVSSTPTRVHFSLEIYYQRLDSWIASAVLIFYRVGHIYVKVDFRWRKAYENPILGAHSSLKIILIVLIWT